MDSKKSDSFLIIVGMLPPDYISSVLRDYEKKKANKTLSSNLKTPTPRELKDECVVVYTNRHFKHDDKILFNKDEKTLKEFFKRDDGDPTAYLRMMKKYPTVKFKTLARFLNKKTRTTNSENIELLAWLIDFKDRPYDPEKKYDLEERDVKPGDVKEKGITGEEVTIDSPGEREEEVPLPGEPGQTEELIVPPSVISKPSAPNFKIRGLIIATLTLIFLAIGIYWSKINKTVALTGHEACMYWDDDHYQPIACDQKPDNNNLVIALDSERLVHFRRITDPDTITDRSIGHVWYVSFSKENKEYYTSYGDGFHPVDHQRSLKPITAYIIRIHIKKTNTTSLSMWILIFCMLSISVPTLFTLKQYSLPVKQK